VLDVIDHIFVVMNPGKDFATVRKLAALGKIEDGGVAHFAQGKRLALLIGGHPDFRQATAVDQFLEIKTAESPGLGRGLAIGFGVFKLHERRSSMP
jgi:hypothetical protein